MREGGLSTTLNVVLLCNPMNVDIASRWNAIANAVGQQQQPQQMELFLVNEALRLGDPKRSMTLAQHSLETIWQMISKKCNNNPMKSSTPNCPTPRAILISKQDWMTTFIYPETRMGCATKEEEDEEEEASNQNKKTNHVLTQTMLDSLPLGLRLARQAPQAHFKALNDLRTEYDGYLLQHEMLSFGERQSQGYGLSCLNVEVNDGTKTLRTKQANLVRLLFDAVGKVRKGKRTPQHRETNAKLPKSQILKAIAYETKVRTLLLHKDCPPGLQLATTDPRKFRRLLQRALTATTEEERVEASTSGGSSGSSPKKSKSKPRDAMLSQADVLAIALKIEHEETDAPRRARLRNAGEAIRSALDLVADGGSIMGVRKDDLLLALRNKRNVIGYLTGGGDALSLPKSVMDLIHVTNHAMYDFETKRDGWVTAKELLQFCGVVVRVE